MARFFDGSNDKIQTTVLGGAGIAFGPATIAMIQRRASDTGTALGMFRVGTGSLTSTRYALRTDDSTATSLSLRCGNSAVKAPTITTSVADGWSLVAAAKASGSVKPRFHRYVFSTGAWTHEDAASNLADSALVNSGTIGVGEAAWTGDIQTAAVWNRVLTDAEIELLPMSLLAWLNSAPVFLWHLDQENVSQLVRDLTGGGANQTTITDTAVVDGPPGFAHGGALLG